MKLTDLEKLRMPKEVSSVRKDLFNSCACASDLDYCEDCWSHVQFSDICVACGEYIAWTPLRTDKRLGMAYYRCERRHEWSCSWGDLADESVPDVRVLAQWEWDAADLVAAQLPAIETLPLLGHYGYIGKGFSNLLAAYPKTGKTTLILHAIQEWLEKGITVRYFSEEPIGLWQPRLSLLTEKAGDLRGRFTLICGMGRTSKELLEKAYQSHEDVLVMDTLRSHLGFEDENNNSEVQKKVEPWIVASRDIGATFVAMHHTRKSGGSHGMAIAGGSALFGAVDQAVELNLSGKGDKYREVSGIGRLGNPDGFSYEMKGDALVAEEWKSVGSDQQTLKEILGILERDKKLPGAQRLAMDKGWGRAATEQAYKALVAQGKIRSNGKGYVPA